MNFLPHNGVTRGYYLLSICDVRLTTCNSRAPPINAQCRSIPINDDQNCAIDPNADQKRSMPINDDQIVSILLNVRSMLLDPALIGIDQY